MLNFLLPVLFSLSAASTPTQSEAPKFDRAEATSIIAGMRKIVVPGGIDRLEKVQIGGIDQWVSIRGNDPKNPVLLMLHGGPGWVSMPTSWYFQRGWEEYFTVVQWDQRGAGKTYAENDPEKIIPTLTVGRMVSDTEEMVAWLRKDLRKDKIFVIGHSWGSYLGLQLARNKPQWLHAYVGMGQVTDSVESERRGWAWTIEQARKNENSEAIRDLESIAPYAQGDKIVSITEVMKQRKWLNFYGGMVHSRQGGDAEAAAFKLSPEYTDADLAKVWQANETSINALLPAVLATNFNHVDKLDCPTVLFLGRHDVNVSSSVAAEWFERLRAPSKRIVWFENSAHEVMNEEPGKTLVALVEHVRPLAKQEVAL